MTTRADTPSTPPTSPALLAAELVKLRHSQLWVMVVGLPLVVVGAGIATTAFSGHGLEDGWRTLWLRTVGFHGLFPMVLGVAILASLVWRPEHRDGNWNALRSAPTRAVHLVTAKALAVAGLAVGMQLVMVVIVVVVGWSVFGLRGLPPGELLASGAVTAVACVGLAAFQSGVSMMLRSFTAPVAVAAGLACLSVTGLTARVGAVAYLLPQGLATRAALLGSGLFGDPGHPRWATYAVFACTAVVMSTVAVVGSGQLLKRRELRA